MSSSHEETHEEVAARVAHWIDVEAHRLTERLEPGSSETMHAIAEVLFSDDNGPPDSDLLNWLCHRTEELSEGIGGKGALIFRLGLVASAWAAPPMIGKLPPLKRLSFADRVHALERFEASPLGMTLFAVKAFLSISYFEHPDVAERIGFDGAALKEATGGAGK